MVWKRGTVAYWFKKQRNIIIIKNLFEQSQTRWCINCSLIWRIRDKTLSNGYISLNMMITKHNQQVVLLVFCFSLSVTVNKIKRTVVYLMVVFYMRTSMTEIEWGNVGKVPRKRKKVNLSQVYRLRVTLHTLPPCYIRT